LFSKTDCTESAPRHWRHTPPHLACTGGNGDKKIQRPKAFLKSRLRLLQTKAHLRHSHWAHPKSTRPHDLAAASERKKKTKHSLECHRPKNKSTSNKEKESQHFVPSPNDEIASAKLTRQKEIAHEYQPTFQDLRRSQSQKFLNEKRTAEANSPLREWLFAKEANDDS